MHRQIILITFSVDCFIICAGQMLNLMILYHLSEYFPYWYKVQKLLRSFKYLLEHVNLVIEIAMAFLL
jgi:hypothetical protein